LADIIYNPALVRLLLKGAFVGDFIGDYFCGLAMLIPSKAPDPAGLVYIFIPSKAPDPAGLVDG